MLVMDVLYKWVDTLKPYSNNNKKHSSKQIKMIADSISLFGFRNPIIIDKNNSIIAWHGRLLGAIQLWMQEVPTIVADDLSEEQVRAYRLLDNKIWDFWEYDMDNIIAELQEIWEFKLWFDTLNDLFGIDDPSKEEIEDEIPTIKTNPIVQVWDIFQLGNHRIMCWDSTKKEDVDKLMNEMKADMVRTDPPYNVAYHWHAKNTGEVIMNDKQTDEDFKLFLLEAFKQIKDNVKSWWWIYIRHNYKEQISFQKGIEANDMIVKHQIIWNKPSLWLWWWDYRPKHEICFYCAVKGSQNIFYGDRTNSTVVDLRKEKTDQQILNMIKRSRLSEQEGKTTIFSIRRDNVNEYIHPTQKPVELCDISIKNNSKEEDIVMDLFLWSGVCLISCEKNNRICYWMELDPKYIEVIIKRYYDYTEWKKDIKCINRDLDLSIITNG